MEIMKKPSEMEKKKVLDLFGENMIFALVQSTAYYLNKLADTPIYDIDLDFFMSNWKEWYSLTRLFMLNTSPKQVHEAVMKVTEDLANDYYDGLKIPNPPPNKPKFKTNYTHRKIQENIPIIEVAKKYNLSIKGNKTPCPFHSDSKASLTFYPETNSFFCFGCRVGGDVVSFVQKMMEIDYGKS